MSANLPSAFSITLGLLDSMTATQELVVPRSMPTMLHNKAKAMMIKVSPKNLIEGMLS